MNPQPYHWLALGIILMIAEMFVPTFFLLWLGVGAVVTAVAVWALGLGVVAGVVVWVITSLVFFVIWLKYIQPTLAQNKTKAGLGVGVIVGEVGMIVRVPTVSNAGMIRFNTPKAGASEWAYRTSDPLAVGEMAVVLDVVGNELLVGKRLP